MTREAPEKKRRIGRIRSKIRRFGSSPALNVSLIVLLILTVAVSTRLLYKATPSGQIKFVEESKAAVGNLDQHPPRAAAQSELFGGEAYATAIRLRETGALGMAVSLVIFAEVSERNRMPGNPRELLEGIASRGLMPPGVVLRKGALSSGQSVFSLNYRTNPVGFEVISVPKREFSGPALILRFPLSSLDGKTVTYFQSASNGETRKPKPFSSFATLVASGWLPRQWNGEIARTGKRPLLLLREEGEIWEKMLKEAPK